MGNVELSSICCWILNYFRHCKQRWHIYQQFSLQFPLITFIILLHIALVSPDKSGFISRLLPLKNMSKILNSFHLETTKMVFCFQNCSELQWEKQMFLWLKKTFEIRDWINLSKQWKVSTIYKAECFFTCFWRLFRSNTLELLIIIKIGKNNWDL